MFPGDVAAIPQNSGTPITALVLGETNQCLPPFFLLMLRVKVHCLSLPLGKYSDFWIKVAIIMSFLKKPYVLAHLFMGLFLILIDTFLFPSEL